MAIKKNETFYPQWSVKHPLRTIHAEWPLQNKSMEILAFKCGYFTSNKDNFMIRYRKKCFSENSIWMSDPYGGTPAENHSL